MPVTINVNNLSLCHKASGGMSIATIPDVCKTPSPGGPVPIPYPNIATEQDLAKGTTTVKADGGNMCANYGSEFSKSNGDEPGTVGGVKSGTFIKEATWITYSFDVKLEGKGACRLTDKMFHNHQNTVNIAGKIHPSLSLEEERIIKCILEMCKNKEDRKVVEKTKRLTIYTEKAMKMRTWEYKGGGKWDSVEDWTTAGTANPSTKEVTITRNMPCSEVQRTIVHEVRHTDQPGLGVDPVQMEPDAYAYEEQWAIDRGLPGTFRKQLPDGTWVPDKTRIDSMLTTTYGDASIDRVLPGGTDVLLTSGATVPAKIGQRVSRPYPPGQDLDQRKIPPQRLKCP